MKILQEIECPHCKKKLQEVQVSEPHIIDKPKRIKMNDGSYRSNVLPGTYEWRVKPEK